MALKIYLTTRISTTTPLELRPVLTNEKVAKVSEHFLVEREHVDIIPPTPQTSRRLTTLGTASRTGKVSPVIHDQRRRL